MELAVQHDKELNECMPIHCIRKKGILFSRRERGENGGDISAIECRVLL